MGLRSKVRTAEVRSSAAFFAEKIWKRGKNCAMIQTKTPPAANAAADRREGPVAAMRYRGNENYDALPEALRDTPALLALDGHDAALCRKALAQLRPELPEPEAWLDALCSRLSANLFPDEAHPAEALTPEQTEYLSVLEALFARYAGDPDPLTDLLELPPEALGQSRVKEEYAAFLRAVREGHVLALLRITRELRSFDPASHTIGVHNLALHTAILAGCAGIPVDLPLVSAAAFGHDIGKFGCRGEDAARIPYLHYYYTWQWFSENGMEELGHVAANHSTWDLEFENLPIESLLLIYADFRVRGIRENGRERIRVYSLAASYEMIFSKLADMTPEKQRRYQTVYSKLRDFERLLASYGVPSELDTDELLPSEQKDASLMDAEEALQALRSRTLSGSIRLMRAVSIEQSFSRLLEQAKSEKNLHRIRTDLTLFREYSTYLSKQNKKKLLALLYELLIHPDGDVRRTAGEIMGELLANSGPKYRKERPHGAHEGAMTPAMAALLDEAVELWKFYMQACLYPDRKYSPKHALRIANSLKTICQSMFAACEEKQAPHLLAPLLAALEAPDDARRFVLTDALCHVPCRYFPQDALPALLGTLREMLQSEELRCRVIAMQLLRHLSALDALRGPVSALAAAQPVENEPALAYLRGDLTGTPQAALSEAEISLLYLSNLKNAVHWTVKLEQISLLCADAMESGRNVFHTALHFSNLLCVSEHLPVRESAGQHLLRIAPMLSADQANEIACDLLRELETGEEQITRFIPPYIGRFICLLPEKELLESVEYLEKMAHGAAPRTACVALEAIGEVVVSLRGQSDEMTWRLLGNLMTGVSHYDDSVHQAAMQVLCCRVFGSGCLPLALRGALFARLHKKLLTLLSQPRQARLTVFHTAAMLNHLYRFLVRHEVELGAFPFGPQKPAAFFPGTFDPFSAGHKQIVERIRSLGFEVYLAVDEFSWSKKALAKLLRRQIVAISAADQWDTYLFPDDIPINIAMPRDLAQLKTLLPGREVYLVAGSDVIRNASAYRSTQPGSAAEYNHIIFYRGEDADSGRQDFSGLIRGKLRVLTLPAFYETVSSTRIREYVDRGLDISMLVDPVVQSFIYENGLYIREPESKSELSRQELQYHLYLSDAPELPEKMREALLAHPSPIGVTLRQSAELAAWAVGHTIQVRELYDRLGSLEAAREVRQRASGRLLLVDALGFPDGVRDMERCRMLLNELLARSLDGDHTYAVCRCAPENAALREALLQLGFLPIPSGDGVYCVDMRAPVMLLQDVMLTIKQPHHDDPAVKAAVMRARPRLRAVLGRMFPGKLLLCFDSELLNQSLMERVQRIGGVDKLAPGERLCRDMCVPYGKILSDVVVPHIVTKTLHAEKCFDADLRRFDILEFPGYSPLRNQVRMLKSFERPVLLVDDLLHNGYRIEKLDKIFREEGFEPEKIVVAILSGRGRDIMQAQGRAVECEYFIPNLHYWVTESLLYPFLGGDSVEGTRSRKRSLPSINLILPYYYPNYFRDAAPERVYALSETALENALEILRALEKAHQEQFASMLTIRRLGEALYRPRLPEQGQCMLHDGSLPASAYLLDSLQQLDRIRRKEPAEHELL